MEKELSKELTEIYQTNNDRLSEKIDNLPDGYVVITDDVKVTVFANIEDAVKNCTYLQDEENILSLESYFGIDIDDLNIQIVG